MLRYARMAAATTAFAMSGAAPLVKGFTRTIVNTLALNLRAHLDGDDDVSLRGPRGAGGEWGAIAADTWLGRVLDLKVGETLLFDVSPNDPVSIKCGGIPLTTGTMGKDEDSIAVRVDRVLQKPKMTLAAFERAMQKEMDPT